MKRKIYSAIILFSLAAPVVVDAVEGNTTEVHGVVELGVMGVDNNTNSAFFQEFRDIDDKIIGNIQLDALKAAYHFQLDGEDIGADDQSFQFKGGRYGNFKYQFNYDEMPHNYTFDAITPFTGVGTKAVTLVSTPTDTATWTKFDYGVEHKSYGGEFEVSLGTPFYVKVGAEKRDQSGLRPYSVAANQSSPATRKFAEVPEPISNTTDNLHLKGGYLGESLSVSLAGYLSSFNNDNKYFTRSDLGAVHTAVDKNNVLAQDNDYSKIAGDFSWRGLPLSSVVAGSASFANLENDFTATDINYSNTMLATLINLNRTNFEGEVDYTNAAIALSSQPLDKLDTKIYYNYLERDNKSSVISYGASPATAITNNARELLSYDKNTFGIDIGFRLPSKNKLDAGYEYQDMERSTQLPAYTEVAGYYNRYDNPESTTDGTIYASLKNSYLDWLIAKVKYSRLDRDSDINTTYVLDPSIYTTRFDAQDKTMDEVKLAFELYPIDNLDLGLDLTHQNNDYDDNITSRTDDTRQKVYADVSWRAATMLKLGGFVGFEKTEIDANHRTNLALVADRTESTDDDYWTYGLSANIAATEQLSFDLSWQYEDSDGSLDFTSLGAATYTNFAEIDDYTKNRLEAKATYAIDPKLKMTLGYMYEKLEYDDYAYNNYTYVSGSDYVSGLYADPNYEANLGYFMVSYGF